MDALINLIFGSGFAFILAVIGVAVFFNFVPLGLWISAIAAGVKAGALVKAVAAVTGGNGGGKPDFAMAGAKDVSKVDEALATVAEIVASMM